MKINFILFLYYIYSLYRLYKLIEHLVKLNKMSTTASLVNPSTVSPSPFVIPHAVTTGSDPSKTAMELGAARNEYQHGLVQVSKGKMGGGKNKNKNKKSKKYSRKSAMKKRFSKRFRRSVLRRKSRKMSLHKKNKKALRGGSSMTANNNGDNKLTIPIPSFRQASPTGSGIINQLAGSHAQTLAYSAYDGEVSKPPGSPGS